ncbi:uncharacterized protein LODBEIA_P07760 [Lodderomyces beijingensis]|uniref:GDP/GTP exchange factor Sec2 N-terminal domain-containing protein n=1 Tax=Lodderomyces beijingensis TaxID=1775926 RepID=A0ABP0ZEH1_9ASCO
MEAAEDFESRLAQEIGNLSTRLVTAVNKQVELEETNLQLRKQIFALTEKNKLLATSDENYRLVLPKYLKLQDEFKDANIKKEIAESENSKLRVEVEDLTASLFDEANTMVSNASRETHNFKVKNRKLYEEIDEKNIIISNLQDQLQDLKQMFIKIEDQQRLMHYSTGLSTPRDRSMEYFASAEGDSGTGVDEDASLKLQQLSDCLYSPQIAAIRFDLNNYNKDFKGFVYALIKPDFQFDLIHLKNLAYFKSVWSEEVENAIGHIPALPQTSSILNRWQKGKNFWTSLVEGRVSIEPVKGYHEYKEGKMGKANPELLQLAIRDSCSFCGEFRGENFEQCRFHHYKIYEVDETLVAQYPLCSYCVIKLRNLCEFFAKLRLIKSNVFKLQQNSSFDEFAPVASAASTFYKRSTSSSSTPTMPTYSMAPSSTTGATSATGASTNSAGSSPAPDSNLMNGHVHGIELDLDEESKLIKIYLMLVLVRLKIFWGRLGIWDNGEQINEININEINHDVFVHLIPPSRRQNLKSLTNSASKPTTPRHSAEIENPTEEMNFHKSNVGPFPNGAAIVNSPSLQSSPPANANNSPEADSSGTTTATTRSQSGGDAQEEPEAASSNKSLENNNDEKSISDRSEYSSAVSESQESKHSSSKSSSSRSQPQGNDPGLQRRKSQTKEFKMKIDKDLNQTLEMLAENLKE